MNKDKCESLSETREKIDAIDNDLIALIAQRQFYVDQAMRFKSSVQDVQSPERVEQVIAHVRAKALIQDVDADLVEKIYREMIQHFIQRELKELRP
ncbi:chorismate mutase [Acinetobacter sp. KS-LM10]|uniref:chorismate mutase n=1 Tax=Acinetobacter sp. KS-LM10 TaxID=3120518 RepID=UPI0030CEF289